MKLIVYGSFNCPYCYLASRRVDGLVGLGAADVEWRAVVHDPGVPVNGVPVVGELAEMFDRELEEIRGLLGPGESFPAVRPTVQPNTTLAVAGYSATTSADADRLRERLFDAFWVESLDIGDPGVLREMGCPTVSPGVAAERWRAEWLGHDRPIIPMAVLPDGTVSRGLGVLTRLADLGVHGGASR